MGLICVNLFGLGERRYKYIGFVQQDVIWVKVGELFEDVWVSFAFKAVTQLSFEVRFFEDEVVHEPDDDDAADEEPQEAVRGDVRDFKECVREDEDGDGVP